METSRPNLLRSLTGNLNHFIALCYYVYVTRFSIGHQSYVLRENGFVPREQMEFFPGPTFRIAYLTHICEVGSFSDVIIRFPSWRGVGRGGRWGG